MKTITLPENKLNELAQQVSAQMFAQHSFDDGLIGGDELKQFAPHKQINKFLIFQVYQVWEMQMNKLRHPYFNLDHEDIAGTLQILKNQISQHIEVQREDFRPMLERAVYNNLKLLVDPKASFNSFFFAQKESLPLPVYQRFSQFFSDMDFIVNSILRYYQKNNIEEVEKEGFFEKMDKVIEVYNRKSETGFDAYRANLFRQISGRNLEEVVEEAEEEERARLEKERKEQEEQEAKRKAEEAAAKQAEEAARLQAEEEARKKAEEEAKRLAEEERKKEEEERKKAEEAAKKLSFFDTISTSGDSFFDLDEEDGSEEETAVIEVEETPADPEPEESVAEEVKEEEIHIEIEEEPTPEPKAEVEVVEESDPTTFVEVLEESVEEIIEEPTSDEIVEEVEVPASEETVVEESVEALVEEPVETEIITEEIADEVEEEVAAEPEVLEEEFQEMAKSLEPEEEQNEPKTILDKIGNKQESTSSYLDQFLNQKSNGHPKEEPKEEAPKEEIKAVEESEPNANGGNTILDKIVDKPKTIADSFQLKEEEQSPVGVNGNRKIKLDEIPIHKQYQYVQKVFDGNNVRFRIIVDKVNNAKNKGEVEDILNKFVLSNDSLDKGDGVVSEFIGLLRNRF